MADEPLSRQARDFIQSTGFLEQMGRAGNDNEFPLITHEPIAYQLVEFDDLEIEPADDEQRRRSHQPKCFNASQIRPAAARDDGGG